MNYNTCFRGRRVVHPKFGRGVIRATRHQGLFLQVDFENGNSCWTHLREVSFLDSSPQSAPDEQTGDETARNVSSKHDPEKNKSFKYRKIIEAFRLGVAPEEHVEETVFGRHQEQRHVDYWLTGADYPCLLVNGEYGAGKTHLLRWTYQKALRSGWAVAFAEVDPGESPFNRPKQLFKLIAASLRFINPKTRRKEGYRELIRYGLINGSLREHFYYRELLSASEVKWEWIEARRSHRVETGSFPLYDYSKSVNIYCYLLSGLAVAACALGLRGICLLFDEAESYQFYDYYYQYEQGLNSIRALVRLAFHEKSLLGNPADTGLDYCRKGMAGMVPFAYRKDYKLKIAFALTEKMLPLQWELLRCGAIPSWSNLELQPLTQNDFYKVFEKIKFFYEQGYEYHMDKVSPDYIFQVLNERQPVPRRFIKACIELFDLMRFGIEIS